MQKRKKAIGLIISISVLSWLVLLALDLVMLFSAANHFKGIVPALVPKIAFISFILSIASYYHFKVGKADSINFSDLLWQVFVTGMLTAAISLLIRLFFLVFSDSSISLNTLTINFFYHINLALVVIFIICTYTVWKRLVLYQKSRGLIRLWQVFEYTLLLTLCAELFNLDFFDTAFLFIIVTTSGLSLVVSFNLKWVAYLNFKQKLRSLLFLFLVGVYLFYFTSTLFNFSLTKVLVFDLVNSEIVVSLLVFISIYASTSFLVILFNLPTSSVFENKLKEIVDFQRLSRSISEGSSPDQIYKILLDSSVSGVYADAGIISIYDNGTSDTVRFYCKHIDQPTPLEWNNLIQQFSFKKTVGIVYSGSSKSNQIYPTALKAPIISQKREIGHVLLLKNVTDGFDKEMTSIIDTFVNQASISLENINLLNETLKTERYKEELKIASKVQQSLLPSALKNGTSIDISAISIAADEVGGDYYDIYWHSPTEFSLIIGDVSGKGTSAAFNMSQMKGVFHSLVNLNLTPKAFVTHANDALSRCLEKSSFITATYFMVDIEERKIRFVRAGHCPTLYYDKESKEVKYFRNKGLGLGLLRNSNYEKYVHVNEFHYQTNDIILLYTDGIVEACNKDKERYGYDRLKSSLQANTHLCAKKIQKNIIDDLYDFCENDDIHDDYSLVIVKF